MKERDFRLDYCRAIAVLFVIIQHVLIFMTKGSQITIVGDIVLETLLMITKSAVPLFVMVTGALLLGTAPSFSISRGLKYAKRMLSIILFWNIIAALYNMFMGDGIKEIISALIYGKWWFLYMMVGLYLYMAIADLIVRDRSVSAFVIISFLLFELYLSLSLFFPELISSPLDRFVNKFFPQFFLTNIGTVIIGSVIYNKNFSISRKVLYLMAPISLISIMILLSRSVLQARREGILNYVFFDEFSAIIIAAEILFLGLRFLKNDLQCKPIKRIVTFLGQHSLGMYVVSNLILETCQRYEIKTQIFGNVILGTFVLGGGITITSLFIVWIISKTMLRRFV